MTQRRGALVGEGLPGDVGRQRKRAPLADSTVFLIRHAEDDPAGGSGLSPAGQARADAYASLFSNLPTGRRTETETQIDYLFATHSTDGSARPYLTLKPLAKRLSRETGKKVKIHDQFHNHQHQQLAEQLLGSDKYAGKTIVICWHHKKILSLADEILRCAALPKSARWPNEWPDDVYGWLLRLSFDASAKRSGATRCFRRPTSLVRASPRRGRSLDAAVIAAGLLPAPALTL
jgi:hypothetical protein